MSAISLKSITGITSITTPSGVDNQLTLHTNNTTERVKIDVAGNVHVNNHLSVTGIVTFSHTGANQLVIKDSDTSGDAAHMRISFQDSGGTEKFFVGNNNSNGWLYLGSPSGQNNNIAFRVNGSDKFQVNAAGVYVNGDLTVNGTVDILDSIIHTGDTNTKIRFPAADTISFETAGSEKLRIKSDGTVIAGATAVSGGNRSQYSILAAVSNNTSATGHGVFTIQAGANSSSGNEVAQLCFSDPQGDYAWIQAFADNATGATDKPGRLVFSTTADGQTVPAERLRITSGGNVQVNGGALHLDASGELAVFETDTNLAFTNSAKLAFDFSGNVARIRTSGNGSFTTRNLGLYFANSQKLLITTDKVMFSADAKVDTTNTRDLGADGAKWKTLYLGTQLNIDAASSTEMIMLDVSGTNFAKIGHNSASGVAVLDVRSEGHTRFLTNGNNERLRITSDGKILVAEANNYHADADDLVLRERSGGNVGMTLQNNSNANVYGVIYFADSDAQHSGRIQYDHSNDSFDFFTAGTEKVSITSGGLLKVNSTDSGSYHTIRLNTTTNNAIKDVLHVHSSVDGATAAAGYGVRLNFSGEQSNGNEYTFGGIAGLFSSTGATYGDLAFYTNNNGTNGERLRIKSDSSLLHTRTDNVGRYDVEFKNTGGISDGNYGGIRWSQGSTGGTSLAAIEIAYANSGRPDIVFKHRNRGGGTTFDEAMRIDRNAKIGINNSSPECRSGGIDMSSNVGTSGKAFTDLRGESQLVIRNPSTTQHSFTQLLFENGGGTSAATMFRHRLGSSQGSLQNFVGDMCLFRRTGNAGGSNADYRESTRWCGANEQARQVWWASGDSDTSNTNRLGWHHLSIQRDHPGTDAYSFFRLETGAASYARGGFGKYTCVWTTGHASGYGLATGHFGYYMNHGNSRIYVNEHIIYRERYSNGSYYGWDDSPNLRICNYTQSGGTNAAIVFRVGGRRYSGGYDMSVMVGLFIELYAPESANGDTNPRLYSAGNSQSNLDGGGFGSPVNHDYVTFQSSNPNHSGQP